MRTELLRQSFLGAHSDDVLAAAHIAVVGVGGGGSHVIQQLAHVGIGTFTLFDPDIAKRENMNRLVGATQQDVRDERLKVDIARRVIESVSETAHVHPFATTWQDNFLQLREADIIVGCVDSFSERAQLEAAARRCLTPYVDLGMDVYDLNDRYAIAGQVALSMPGGACLRCMGIVTETSLAREQYGAAGGLPQVVWPNGILASAAVGILVELLTPWFPGPSSELLRLEGNSQQLTRDRWLAANIAKPCEHYPLTAVGDPFYTESPVR